jgi:Holliday junction resolvase RusA-like endonuclease
MGTTLALPFDSTYAGPVDDRMIMWPIRFTVLGDTRVKKNSRQWVKRGKKMCSIASDAYLFWEESAVIQLRRQWGRQPAIPKDLEVNAAFLLYMETHRKTDTSNLYQGPEDALQRAKILEDDCCIVSHDGSRRLYDKDNPRVEITLTIAEPWHDVVTMAQ